MYSNNIVRFFDFKNQEVRVVNVGGVAWFALKDLGEVLGMKRLTNNVRKILSDAELHVYFVDTKKDGRASRKTLCTNESGVYTLIMRSNKPEAREFRYWVTNTVLPSIKNTGSYMMSSEVFDAEPVMPLPVNIMEHVEIGDTVIDITVRSGSRKMLDAGGMVDIHGLITDLVNVLQIKSHE